jgi:hypothetical protein
MQLDEFENRYRELVDRLGNQLQNSALELARLENLVVQMGNSLANLNGIVEEFTQQQQDEE